MDYHRLITIDPERRSGKPSIRDTRMTVGDVLDYLASGMSPDQIVAEFPTSPLMTSGLAWPSRPTESAVFR